MTYPEICIWKDKLLFRFDQHGKVIESWYTLIVLGRNLFGQRDNFPRVLEVMTDRRTFLA